MMEGGTIWCNIATLQSRQNIPLIFCLVITSFLWIIRSIKFYLFVFWDSHDTRHTVGQYNLNNIEIQVKTPEPRDSRDSRRMTMRPHSFVHVTVRLASATMRIKLVAQKQ